MFSEEDFAGMYEALEAKFDEVQGPYLAEFETAKLRLARLEEKEQEYRELIDETLPQQRQAILAEIAELLGEGEDVATKQQELREIDQQIKDAEDVASNLVSDSIPRARRLADNAERDLNNVRIGAVDEVRAVYVAKAKDAFDLIFAASVQWDEACSRIVNETGMGANTSNRWRVIFPTPAQLKHLFDIFE